MKNIFSLFFFTLHIYSLNIADAKNLEAYFNYCSFYSPQQGPYLETYLIAIGNSLEYIKKSNGKFVATIGVTILFKQADAIRNFKKYFVHSPEIDDTTGEKPNFIDLQRFILSNGLYDMELNIFDSLNQTNIFKYNISINIEYNSNDLLFSDIQLVESYKKTVENNILSKSGFDLKPYVSTLFPQNMKNFIFYTEIYNTDKIFKDDQGFLVTYYIKSYRTNDVYKDLSCFQKKKPKPVIVILGEFSIEKLPSGNFSIVIEIKNKNNQIVKTEELFFQRINPDMYIDISEFVSINADNTFVRQYNNKDTLIDYIKCLRPISDEREELFAKNVIKNSELSFMQNYFYNFWFKRNSENPELEWNKYYSVVKIINKSFSSQIKNGYDTDKGRVYLQYGAPNQIIEEKYDPNAFPYEIWHYYHLNTQNDVKFIFYNPDIAGKEYILLHSDARGEINTPNWDMILHKRNTPMIDPDQRRVDDYYGGKATEIYDFK
ncbi:MAG: GWxTD domain-containing protein [Bacteroidia bacterium]|nr:GWxTD domain-containing protein [Bacteroidia bacterium]